LDIGKSGNKRKRLERNSKRGCSHLTGIINKIKIRSESMIWKFRSGLDGY